jgi:hypothetical protein
MACAMHRAITHQPHSNRRRRIALALLSRIPCGKVCTHTLYNTTVVHRTCACAVLLQNGAMPQTATSVSTGLCLSVLSQRQGQATPTGDTQVQVCAHSCAHALRAYRSTPCPAAKAGDEWTDPEVCESAEQCNYCHTRTEQQFHPEIYKSTKCNDMLQHGYCPRGPFCAFAHNDGVFIRFGFISVTVLQKRCRHIWSHLRHRRHYCPSPNHRHRRRHKLTLSVLWYNRRCSTTPTT